ncbi:type 4a pilus biogenesis protein PilO [bacterium]|nr:type 4a pilus biogenesis protein PilO [bacterium]MBU1983841.1 type 4a pilus biogenesis protein PilO [bacterium]
MQINLRSQATQKWIIILTLAFGTVYAFVNFAYIPRQEKARRLASEIATESDLLARGKRIAANYQTMQEDYERLMQSWSIAHELLPTQREMEGLLKTITLAGQKRGVTFTLFRPLDPVEKPYYWENPIQIRTLSTYHDLGAFLSDVAALDRIVNVNDLKLREYKSRRKRSSETVDAEFVASIYIFKELGAPVKIESEKDERPAPGRPAPAKPGGRRT